MNYVIDFATGSWAKLLKYFQLCRSATSVNDPLHLFLHNWKFSSRPACVKIPLNGKKDPRDSFLASHAFHSFKSFFFFHFNSQLLESKIKNCKSRFFRIYSLHFWPKSLVLTFLTQKLEAETSKRVDNFFIRPLDRN